jgi:tetratricopeptide (TPR) repeat protein
MGAAPSAVDLRAKRLRTITPPPPFLGWAREAASLEGVDPELALAFWRMLRRVRAWAETPPAERAGLFGAGKREAWERLGAACGHAPGLVEALGTFALLIRAPGEVDARRLSEACSQVHAWAEERSLLSVAMLFAEAAAYADPDDPARANDAGRMCRRAAEDERASSWYHRGYGLGVRRSDPTETIRAQIGYGNLMKDLGQHEEARKFLERAARRAINTGRRRQAGEAHHDLLAIAAEVGTYSEVERHVRRALNLYPIHHPRIPALAHDWAFFLVRSHLFTPAIRLLDMAVLRAHSRELRLLFESTLARAVAGSGMRDRFKSIEDSLRARIRPEEEFAPAALVHLADGARTFSEWERATEYAAQAIELAHARKDRGAEHVASDLLCSITGRVQPPLEAESPHRDDMEALIRRFEARLRKWDTPSRK